MKLFVSNSQTHRRWSLLSLLMVVMLIPAMTEVSFSLVHAAGNPPALGVSDTSTYIVGASAVVVAPGLTITDDDNEDLSGATVSVGTNFQSGTDALGISGQSGSSGTVNGIAWSYSASTGVLKLAGTASTSTYQAALRQVTFIANGSPTANARNVQFSIGTSLANPENGHFYEFVTSNSIDWNAAQSAAAGRKYYGLQGYLTTITSASEQSFVQGKLAGQGWMGASDNAVNKVWRWVTGPEGLEDGGKGRLFFRQNGWSSDSGPNNTCGNGPSAGNQPAGQYTDWASQEPNDSPNGCANQENYGHFLTSGQWNDYAYNNSSISGYIVEYGGTPGDPTLQLTGSASVNVVYGPAITSISPNNGPPAGGTTITIHGTNLANATSVTVGGVAVTPSSNTGTEIVVTVPAHAVGAVDVVVTTSAGTTTQTNGYTYIDTPTISQPANNSYVTSSTVAFAGTASPNSTVAVVEGGSTLCSATADPSGNWTCTATNVSDGLRNVGVTSTIGSATTNPTTTSFTVDTQKPAAPVLVNPANNSTVNTTKPTFIGTAEALSTVTLTVDGVAVCSNVPVDNTGNWSCTAATDLATGAHSVSVTAQDTAGNTSAATTQSFSIDTTRPDAPIITSPTDGSSINTTTPTFTGTAEPNSTVDLTVDGNLYCSTAANAAGNWSCTSSTALSAGSHTATVNATDAGGNTSVDNTSAFEIDLTAPDAPTIGSATITGDVTPTIFGTAEPDSTVTVTVDGQPYCTATTTNAGNWSCTGSAPLAPGSHAVSAVATDAASNASAPATQTMTIDTTQPDAPTITTSALVSDTTPTFAGTAEPNGTVKVSVDGTLVCTTIATVAGDWTCTPVTPIADGDHDVTVVVTDLANNTSPPATLPITIDTTAPDAPTITSAANTSDTTITFTGTAEPFSTVTLSVDGVVICTDVASSTGAWSCPSPTPLTTGPHAVSATATDAANNVSPATTQALVVDTTSPTATPIVQPTPGTAINNALPTFSGVAEPGTTVTVSDGDTVICTATVDTSGNWSCPATQPLADGPHTITTTVTDLAGNESPLSTANFTVDTTKPLPPTFVSPPATIDQTPVLRGVAEPGVTVTVTLDPDNNPATDNNITYVTQANPLGQWSIDTSTATPVSGTFPATGLTPASTAQVRAVATDAAGNTSDAAVQFLYIGGKIILTFVFQP